MSKDEYIPWRDVLKIMSVAVGPTARSRRIGDTRKEGKLGNQNFKLTKRTKIACEQK